MLETRMKKFIADTVKIVDGIKTIKLFQTEKTYVEKHQFVAEEITIIEIPETERFAGAYIERSDKETEEFLGEEKADFLQEQIEYFKKHKNEFMYMESKWFDVVGVDAVSFEVDDVFGTYDVMVGLKLQKKYGSSIQSFFENELGGEEGTKFDLMFDGNEGLWNVNFALDDVAGFKENMTISEAYSAIYRFLFKLGEAVDQF